MGLAALALLLRLAPSGPPPQVLPRAALAPAASFAGAGDGGGGTPPDVQGAAGPDRLLVMLNTIVEIQSRSGAVEAEGTPQDFWAPVSLGDFLFDPRVLYDRLSGRWIAVIATAGETAPPAVLIAISAGSDPGGPWSFASLPASPSGADDAEFPLLGVNGRWICVAANLVSGADGALLGTAIWAVEKDAFAAAGEVHASRFVLTSPGSPVAPVITYDAGEPDEYLLQQWSGDAAGRGELKLFRIEAGAGGAAQLAVVGLPRAPVAWSDHPEPFDALPQAGTSAPITGDQDEVASACLRNGAIWAVQTATLPASGAVPQHSVVQWWRIGPDATVSGFGRVEDPTGHAWYAFPSIAVNARDEILIGYSVFSAGRFASAGYSLRSRGECDAALQTVHLLKAGEGPYVRLDAGGHNRWGDLSETVVDPADDVGLWTLQEYAASPAPDGAGRWGTWWGGFAASPASREDSCLAPGASSLAAPLGSGR